MSWRRQDQKAFWKFYAVFHRASRTQIFFCTENDLEMSDKVSKCRIREVNTEGLKLTASAMSHFLMASLLEVDRNKRGSLITLCWTTAMTVSRTHLTVRCLKWLCSCFSCHLAFTVPYIYLFSLHYWRAYTHSNNVKSEAMCYGNKCIMVLMVFNIKGQRIRSHSPLSGLHTIPIITREQLPLHLGEQSA